ncbi:MAG TPA: peptidase M28 family protein, partial [Thermoanaerobaculia bacterium]|nr:peptidase M28 family protein [Thermoanaerobaculia bacterium]
MKRTLATIVVASFALVSTSGAADRGPGVIPPVVRKTAESLSAQAFAGTRASEWVRSLIDTAGPRLSGSPGDKAAIAWGLATLKSLGFANVRAEKVMAPFWERGVETGEVTAPYPHKLFLTALGGSVPTPESGIEADVIEVASLDQLAAKTESEVRGKIVFFNRRMRRT